MNDLFVKLYDLPARLQALTLAEAADTFIRRPIAPERSIVVDWVENHFGRRWADETRCAFSAQPVTCFVAQSRATNELLGFACYDTTFKGFFGPTGVAETQRSKGIGRALLIHTLHAMHESGYAYAIIGQSGSNEFYAKAVAAVSIDGSSPGAYANRIPS